MSARGELHPLPETAGPAAPPGEYQVGPDHGLETRLLARIDDCTRSIDIARALPFSVFKVCEASVDL